MGRGWEEEEGAVKGARLCTGRWQASRGAAPPESLMYSSECFPGCRHYGKSACMKYGPIWGIVAVFLTSAPRNSPDDRPRHQIWQKYNYFHHFPGDKKFQALL